jgi:serine/threonine protein kinase
MEEPDEWLPVERRMLLMLYHLALCYLCRTVGCMAQALYWLHREDVRHKDIKPAQILLSAHGLWLTDFGWSRDVSDLTNSATSGGDIITLKYHAPERAANERCGSAEDIFALGCVFLEVGTRLTRLNPQIDGMCHPWAAKMWYFHANLEDMHNWTAPFFKTAPKPIQALGRLIIRMMAKDPNDRLKINEVVQAIFAVELQGNPKLPGDLEFFTLYRTCCEPEALSSQDDGTCVSYIPTDIYQRQLRYQHQWPP